MKKRLQGFIAGTMAGILIASGVVIASNTTTLYGVVTNGIKIFVDGQKLNPKDANGNIVEPMIYNGTTYLPVRAVADAFGKAVYWDGETSSVYLGEVPSKQEYLVDVCPPYEVGAYEEYTLRNGKSFNMSGNKYTNGFTLMATYDGVLSKYTHAIFNLNGNYKTMSFDIGHIDGSTMKDVTLQVYLDGKLTEEIDLKAESLVKKMSIDLNNAMQLKLVIPNFDGGSNERALYGFADIILE